MVKYDTVSHLDGAWSEGKGIVIERQGPGRPVVLEDSEKRKVVLAKIVPLIEHGMTIIKACEASGVAQTTFYRWKQLGKEVDLRLQAKELMEPDDSFTVAERGVWEFWKSVNSAELNCLDRNLLTVQVASQSHWQAAAWWLERRFPKDYGRYYQVKHSGDEEAPVVVKSQDKPTKEEILRKLTPEQLRTVMEARRIMTQVAAAVVESEESDGESQE